MTGAIASWIVPPIVIPALIVLGLVGYLACPGLF
jgi:hypothetical protein